MLTGSRSGKSGFIVMLIVIVLSALAKIVRG
jgi:hypothetical protein